jgi:pseudaminic acid biosynthesis-associated methylase
MFKTEQEAFWHGAFGDEYVDRCRGEAWIAANTALFSRILERAPGVASVLELGANVGLNLMALRTLLPAATLSAVEINEKALVALRSIAQLDVHAGSILDFAPARTWDMTFTKGVLIHINPDALPRVYDLLHRASSRYILVAEYYNPSPVEVSYRGHTGRLFKRDFAGEIMDRHPDLKLVDYGFAYRRDPVFPQDDLTWFLLEKKT